LFSLIPPFANDLRAAATVTYQAYSSNAIQYVKATNRYEEFPGIREEVITFAEATDNGAPVLDLGSGGGRDSRMLAESGKRVVSGDICLTLLQQSRSLYPDNGIANVCLDGRYIPFRENSFSGVWACGSLLHLPSAYMPSAIAEIFRVLRPGGIAVINMQEGSAEGWREGGTLPGRRWFTLVDPEGFESLMRSCGFSRLSHHLVGRSRWFSIQGFKHALPDGRNAPARGQDSS
jgi:SAM-dependent methyltransferase